MPAFWKANCLICGASQLPLVATRIVPVANGARWGGAVIDVRQQLCHAGKH